jgi:hypothetical protein
MHTVPSARRLSTSTYGIWLIAICGLLAISEGRSLANAEADGAAAVTTVEDPWRRTPNGWELVNRWNRTAVRPTASGFTCRLDSHPAVLALVQSLAIVAAFALFPPRHYFR